jgi:hypothetical protein
MLHHHICIVDIDSKLDRSAQHFGIEVSSSSDVPNYPRVSDTLCLRPYRIVRICPGDQSDP